MAPDHGIELRRRPRRRITVVLALVGVSVVAVGAAVTTRSDDEPEPTLLTADSSTTSPPSAGSTAAGLPLVPGVLRCPAEMIDLGALRPPTALSLGPAPGGATANETPEETQYVVHWTEGEGTVEVRLPATQYVDYTGERVEGVTVTGDTALLWYREGGVQLRAARGPDAVGTCRNLQVTVSGLREDAAAERALEVAEEITVIPEGLTGRWHQVYDNRSDLHLWSGSDLLLLPGEVHSGNDPDVPLVYGPAAAHMRGPGFWPLLPRDGRTGVWSGSEFLVCCGEGPEGELDAAAYDPASDAWRPIEAGPLRDVTRPAGVWAGDRWLVAGDGRLAGYEPTSNQWQELPSAPMTWQGEPAVAWTGTQLAVWPPSADSLLLYEPEAGRWSTAAPTNLVRPTAASLVWTGEEVLAFGQSGGDEAATAGLAYDPAAGGWRQIAPAPLQPTNWFEGTPGSQAATWTGAGMIVFAGALGSDRGTESMTPLLSYDPVGDRWEHLAPAPMPADTYAPALVAADGRLLLGGPMLLELVLAPA